MDFSLNTPGRVFTRQVYTVLDWLSDIGGLFGALVVFIKFAIGLYDP